jgi:proteasome inhibitor subunit 1 (PI31)
MMHVRGVQYYSDIGRADLMPGGLPSPVNPLVSGPFGPEAGGSLLGPRHPGFGPGLGIGPGGFGGPGLGGPGMGMPGARFDPYGPPGVFPGFPGVSSKLFCSKTV